MYKLAFITGASSGIGEALARLLARKGMHLFLTGRNIQNLERLKGELESQVQVQILAADLAKREDRGKIVNILREQAPDLLVNNAGLGFYGDAINRPPSDALQIIEVNVNALVEFTLEAARALASRKQPGTILNVSSVAGFLPVFPGLAAYGASKAFVNSFSQSLDEELAPQHIRVLAACPGVVQTHFQERAGSKKPLSQRSEAPMSAEFAAQEIWKQIESGQTIRIFSGKYRIGVFLTHFIPKKWLAKILRKNIQSRRTG